MDCSINFSEFDISLIEIFGQFLEIWFQNHAKFACWRIEIYKCIVIFSCKIFEGIICKLHDFTLSQNQDEEIEQNYFCHVGQRYIIQQILIFEQSAFSGSSLNLQYKNQWSFSIFLLIFYKQSTIIQHFLTYNFVCLQQSNQTYNIFSQHSSYKTPPMKTIGQLDIQKKKPQSRQDIFFNRKVVVPQKLKILVLSGNDIVSDELQFIHRCINLLKLDLSNNRINKINGKIGMEKLGKLEILYLHNNKIQNAVGLQGVFMLPNLKHLTIRGNPVEKLPRIEHLIVNVMPSLKVLGNRIIFVQQRSSQLFVTKNNVYIETEIAEGWKVKDNSETLYIKILQLQLCYFDNVWVHNNPIIIIQRGWKNALKNKRALKKQQRNRNNIDQKSSEFSPEKSIILNTVKQYFDEWKKYVSILKTIKKQLKNTSTYPQDKSYLTQPLANYRNSKRNHKIQNIVKEYVNKIKYKIFLRRMAERLFRALKKKVIEFNGPESFYEICNISKTHRFYFSKIQMHLIQNFLVHLGDNFGWHNMIKNNTKMGPVAQYLSIRTVDPETFQAKTIHSVFTYSIWPSMRAVFLRKKKYFSKNRSGLIKIKPLYYIKNKSIRLTQGQYKKSIRVYKQLQKFYKKQYENTLQYFQCTEERIMKMVLRYIYYHNTKTCKFEKKLNKNDMQSLLENYNESFLFYADNILERTAAAVRIQQNWRKYLVHRNSQESIYAKMKKTRAVLRIQRFWRDRIFYHRLHFQKNIALQLRLFCSNSFIIPTQIYLKIKDICKLDRNHQLYQGLTLIKSMISKKIKGIWNMKKQVYSTMIAKQNFPTIFDKVAQNQQAHECDIWSLLHLNTNISKLQMGDKQFYEFKFESIQETKYRIYLLALLSYKCRGGTYLLPLSKETLDLYNIRLQQYQKIGLIEKNFTNRSKNTLGIREDKFNSITFNKISTLRIYKQDGFFISFQNDKICERKAYQISIEFYQKMYENFPKKFSSVLYFYLPQQQKSRILQPQQTKTIQKFIQEQRIDLQLSDQKQQNAGQISNINEKSDDRLINITKIDKKRLSLYDFGGRTTQVKRMKEKSSTKTNNAQFLQNSEINDKKNMISRVKRQRLSKKQQIIQNKTENLRKMRDHLSKQKQGIQTAKNIKDFERSQELRKKIQRVREMKRRASKSKKWDSLEDDFIQQGNFVMEQQLKMVIMRTKMQSNNRERTGKTDSNPSSKRNSSAFEQSFYTEEKNHEIKVYENGNFKPIQSLGATLALNNPHIAQQTNQAAGEEKKIVNVRQSKRVKSRSIGAYLRDPSMVHGVFPQQYYPIETREGGTFKFFPRID